MLPDTGYHPGISLNGLTIRLWKSPIIACILVIKYSYF